MKRHYLILFIVLCACSKYTPAPSDIAFHYVNVKDFGAIGDGIIDDSYAFESAMNKADSLKLPVYVPVGIYKARIILPHDNLQIIGQKQPGESVSDGTVILGLINCNYKKNIVIENIGIDSRKQLRATDDAALTSGPIVGKLVLNQQFKNISLIGDGYMAYKHGILCQAGSGITIKNVNVSLFYHGIAIRSSNISIDSVRANNCGFTSIVVKSDLGDNQLTENVSVNHVFINGDPNDAYNRGGTIMITSYGDTSSKTRNITIQNVRSSYGGVACVWIYQNQGVVDNVLVEDCVANGQGDSNTRACFDIAGGSNITFSNCTATNSTGYAFRSTGTVANIKAINCFASNSGVGHWIGTYTYLQLNGIEIIK